MEDRLPRKLAAILYADVAGYSRLTGDDEDATHRTLSGYLDLISEAVVAHHGKVMHYAGDAVLAQFDAAVDALSSAVAVQDELASRNAGLPEERRVEFRIGLNLGDVIEDRGDIYGDGVNVAARLEALAEPGGICISDAVRTAVGSKLPCEYTFIGEHAVKNIREPVRAYGVGGVSDKTQKRARAVRVAPASKESRMGKPTLAVKPFENISGDPTQDAVAHSLTDGILVALTKVPGLALISDESPGQAESSKMSAGEIASRFQVQYVLRGSVRQLGDRMRVNADLLKVDDGRHIWAEQFDRKIESVTDLFDIQDDILAELVTALEVKLLYGEATRLVRKTFSSPAALEFYSRGEHQLWSATTRPEMDEAKRLLEESVRLEPDVPTGYAATALAYLVEVEKELSESPARSLERAVLFANEAISRKDLTGYAHMVIAHVHLMQRKFDDALEAASRAVTDRPSCPGAYSLKANVLNYLGRAKEATELAEYATRLSPLRPPDYAAALPTAYFGCGRFEEAIAASKEAIEFDGRNVDLFIILAASLAAAGRATEARRAGDQVRQLNPGFTLADFAASEPYRDPDTLAELLDQLRGAGLA